MFSIAVLYDELLIVAVVPIIPIRPFFVALDAASAVGFTTPVYGIPNSLPQSPATELTVPHAAISTFIFLDFKKRTSCIAYFLIVSLLRFP